MKQQLENIDNPRKNAIDAMKASVNQDIWERNILFIDSLKSQIRNHPVSRHEAINALNNGEFDKESLKIIHLEYRHAIVQIFTDALLMAQHLSLQLEPRLNPASKMPARFLLALNVLDEFGFRPGADVHGYYKGNPCYAHYPLFEGVLDEFGITLTERVGYQPSGISIQVREFLQSSYDNFATIAALLAVAEEEVILYSPPLRRATGAVGLDVEDGYYNVHGTSEDDSAEAYDDDHEDDLWYVLAQAMTSNREDELRTICMKYCDLWNDFWSLQMRLLDRQLDHQEIAA